jgi:acetolactate synthase-1/3 small subunit
MTNSTPTPAGQSGGVYEAGTAEPAMRHCFAILVDNEPGVLARIAGLFSGRGYNIESLTVDEVDADKNLSRITIVTSGTRKIIDQIAAQLGRLIPVRKVINLTEQGRSVESCNALLKIAGNSEQRQKAAEQAKKASARLVDATGNTVIYELSGAPQAIDRLTADLRPCGLIETTRSGSIAISCGDAVLEASPAVAIPQSA